MNLEWLQAGFFSSLGLWISVLLIAAAWSWAKRFIKG